jgi:hypothetical protein
MRRRTTKHTAGDCREDQWRSKDKRRVASLTIPPVDPTSTLRNLGTAWMQHCVQWHWQNLSRLSVRDDPSKRQKSRPTHPDLDTEPQQVERERA